jgi:hypothetical protein
MVLADQDSGENAMPRKTKTEETRGRKPLPEGERSKPYAVRLHPQAIENIKRLAGAWECSQAAVLERLAGEAVKKSE